MKTTGKLGDVMKESIEAAASYVRSISPKIGVKPPRFEHWDIHVHVPEGATPKDGPSAGLAMVTSIVSVLTQIPVRRDIAMTGEVTLRGNALAIGGLKEKLLAALRGGIKTVLIPKENEKDLVEIPDNVKEGLEIIPVEHVSEVLERALIRKPEAIDWDEADEEAAAAQAALAGRGPGRRRGHRALTGFVSPSAPNRVGGPSPGMAPSRRAHRGDRRGRGAGQARRPRPPGRSGALAGRLGAGPGSDAAGPASAAEAAGPGRSVPDPALSGSARRLVPGRRRPAARRRALCAMASRTAASSRSSASTTLPSPAWSICSGEIVASPKPSMVTSSRSARTRRTAPMAVSPSRAKTPHSARMPARSMSPMSMTPPVPSRGGASCRPPRAPSPSS